MPINFNVNGAGKTQKAEQTSSIQTAKSAEKTAGSENIYQNAPKVGDLQHNSETARTNSRFADIDTEKLEQQINDYESKRGELGFSESHLETLKHKLEHTKADNQAKQRKWDKYSNAANINGHDVSKLSLEERVNLGDAVEFMNKADKDKSFKEMNFEQYREAVATCNKLLAKAQGQGGINMRG